MNKLIIFLFIAYTCLAENKSFNVELMDSYFVENRNEKQHLAIYKFFDLQLVDKKKVVDSIYKLAMDDKSPHKEKALHFLSSFYREELQPFSKDYRDSIKKNILETNAPDKIKWLRAYAVWGGPEDLNFILPEIEKIDSAQLAKILQSYNSFQPFMPLNFFTSNRENFYKLFNYATEKTTPARSYILENLVSLKSQLNLGVKETVPEQELLKRIKQTSGDSLKTLQAFYSLAYNNYSKDFFKALKEDYLSKYEKVANPEKNKFLEVTLESMASLLQKAEISSPEVFNFLRSYYKDKKNRGLNEPEIERLYAMGGEQAKEMLIEFYHERQSEYDKQNILNVFSRFKVKIPEFEKEYDLHVKNKKNAIQTLNVFEPLLKERLLPDMQKEVLNLKQLDSHSLRLISVLSQYKYDNKLQEKVLTLLENASGYEDYSHSLIDFLKIKNAEDLNRIFANRKISPKIRHQFLADLFLRSEDLKKEGPQILKLVDLNEGISSLLTALEEKRAKSSEENKKTIDGILKNLVESKFPSQEIAESKICLEVCNIYKDSQKWMKFEKGQVSFLLGAQFEHFFRNVYFFLYNSLENICSTNPRKLDQAIDEYAIYRNGQMAYEDFIKSKNRMKSGYPSQKPSFAYKNSLEALEAVKGEMRPVDYESAKNFLNECQGGLSATEDFSDPCALYGNPFRLLFLKSIQENTRYYYQEKLSKEYLKAIEIEIKALTVLIEDQLEKYHYYDMSKAGSGLHTFAYTTMLLSLDAPKKEIVENLEHLYKKLKNPLAVPYFINFYGPFDKNTLTEENLKKSSMASPRGAAARAVPFYLSLYRFSSDSEVQPKKTELLLEAVKNYDRNLPSLYLHAIQGDLHSGEDGIASYYFMPSLPYYANSLKLLLEDKKLSAEKKEEVILLKRKLLNFTLKLIANKGDLPLKMSKWSNASNFNYPFLMLSLLQFVNECNGKKVNLKFLPSLKFKMEGAPKESPANSH